MRALVLVSMLIACISQLAYAAGEDFHHASGAATSHAAAKTNTPNNSERSSAAVENETSTDTGYKISFLNADTGALGGMFDIKFSGKEGLPKACKDLAIFIQDQVGLATDCQLLRDGIYRFSFKCTESNMVGRRSLIGRPFSDKYQKDYNVVVTVNDTTFPSGKTLIRDA